VFTRLTQKPIDIIDMFKCVDDDDSVEAPRAEGVEGCVDSIDTPRAIDQLSVERARLDPRDDSASPSRCLKKVTGPRADLQNIAIGQQL
jgi:hypothetical protein